MSRQKPNGAYWKRRVLAKFPNAHCDGYAGRTYISFHVMNGDEVLGIGDTVRGAWKAAGVSLRQSLPNKGART